MARTTKDTAKDSANNITILHAVRSSHESKSPQGQVLTFDAFQGQIRGEDFVKLALDYRYQREPQSDEYCAAMIEKIAANDIGEVTLASRDGRYKTTWEPYTDDEGTIRQRMDVTIRGNRAGEEPLNFAVDGQSRRRAVQMMLEANKAAEAQKQPLPYPDIKLRCRYILKTTLATESAAFVLINDPAPPVKGNLLIRNYSLLETPDPTGELVPLYPVLKKICSVVGDRTSGFPFVGQTDVGVNLGRRAIPLRLWIRLVLEFSRLKGARMTSDNLVMVQTLETIASTVDLVSEQGGPARRKGGDQVVQNFLTFAQFMNRALALSEALDQKQKPIQCETGLLMAYASILSLPPCWVGSDAQATADGHLFELRVPDDIAGPLSNLRVLRDPEVKRLAPSNKRSERVALAKYILEHYVNTKRSKAKRIPPELLDRGMSKVKAARRRKAKGKATEAKPTTAATA